MPGDHIRRWPDAHQTTHIGHPGWRSWRPDDNQNRAYPSRQTVQLEGSTSLLPASQPEGSEGNPSGGPRWVVANSERQGVGRPGPDVQPVYPRLDQLLQSLLQDGVVSGTSPD